MITLRTVRCLLWLLLVTSLPLALPSRTEARPQSIRVVMDNNYPPYVFLDSAGKQQGILIDQWRLWEQKTGIRVDISAMDWSKALRSMRSGEFDVIDTIFKTEERSGWLDFSEPYARLEVPIFFDKEIPGISDTASLKGFVVAAKTGDNAVDILKNSGINTLMLFNSYEEIIRTAKEHKISVFVVDKPPALYFLHKFGILNHFRQTPPLYVGEFHRAVAKGNGELLATVQDGFRLITANELKKIESKWLGSSLGNSFPTTSIVIGAVCLSLLVLILFAWNRILRKMVNTRIAELKASGDSLRANEAFVKTLMNAIPIPIFYKDNTGRYMGFNSSFEEFYGVVQTELVGKSVFDIAPKELAEIYHAKDLELFQHAGSQIYESQVKNSRGDLRDVVFHKASFTDTGGQVCGLIGAILDITERNKAEQDRLNLERRLLHSQKLESLGILSGGIAHDFNNLLQALLGNLDLALRKLPQDTAARNNIHQAITAGRHAAQLTGMMLAYSGKGLFIIKPLNLTELLEENAAMLEAGIPKSITLEKHLDHTLPHIKADAGQLQQVIMNLITNAAEAIGDATGTISLTTGVGDFNQATLNLSRLEEKTAPGRYVWLEVRDNGCGMDEETIHKLFDPFFTTKFTGRGLGMSAVQGIIRAHKGAFLVNSVPDVGTTIKVLFPAAGDHPASPDQINAGEPHQDEQVGSAVKILVIDDEEMVRSVSSSMLEELGFSTVAASSGEEALALFRKSGNSFDVVLLDQVMPGMDGVTVFKELRHIRPDIKVLLASGFSQQEVSERFKGLGLNGFIPKPYTLANLTKELAHVLNGVNR
ncbi:MAG: transporter substrate-binding domain-containing protein [Pelobacteraceae bacterium]